MIETFLAVPPVLKGTQADGARLFAQEAQAALCVALDVRLRRRTSDASAQQAVIR